jgi:hypothetical protein
MTATQPHQPALVLDQEDALREVTRALGGAKTVGARLRPDLDPDAAGRWWHDCISMDRQAKADLSQIITVARWGRDAGCHALMDYLAGAAGYSRPEPVCAQDEQAEQYRRFCASVENLQRLAAQMGVRR